MSNYCVPVIVPPSIMSKWSGLRGLQAPTPLQVARTRGVNRPDGHHGACRLNLGSPFFNYKRLMHSAYCVIFSVRVFVEVRRLGSCAKYRTEDSSRNRPLVVGSTEKKLEQDAKLKAPALRIPQEAPSNSCPRTAIEKESVFYIASPRRGAAPPSSGAPGEELSARPEQARRAGFWPKHPWRVCCFLLALAFTMDCGRIEL